MRIEVRVELDRIQKGNPHGLLVPLEVVQEAGNPASPLHDEFEWDDKKASYQYRLNQARFLIREVTVEMQPHHGQESRVYVSVIENRTQPNGGYRVMAEVLSTDHGRAQLLDQALRELNHFKSKYFLLTELVGVFAAADQIQRDKGNGLLPPPAPANGGQQDFV